jgi:hypothetical protein
MRILFILAALLMLATFAPPSLHRPEPPPARTILAFEPVPLEEGAPDSKAAGRLRYLGGWRITSNDFRFGGISAMHVVKDEVTAVSDAGSLIRFSLPGPGRPSAARIDALPDGPGSARVKGDRDAEAMTVHGGRAWIGFERRNAVWRYRRGNWRSDSAAAPAGMRKWRSNRGGEAMLRLPGGRFLIFSEGGGGESPVLLFDGDPALPGTKAQALRYRPPPGYRITDAARLPDGRLLLLNRRVALFEGMSAKLSLAAPPGPKAGIVLAGEVIAELRRPLTVDNMEALSVTRENGRTIVWIASDDNFNPLQRTLLLKFALEEERTNSPPRRKPGSRRQGP